MSDLLDYLDEKAQALAAREKRLDSGEAGPVRLAASVRAEGRSGVRRIRIRDHQVITDSPPDFAGYDLGPSSPELQLGVLGSCLTHIVLIQAAQRRVPVASVEVEVSGVIDPRAGRAGFEQVPVAPHALQTRLHIVSPASAEVVQALVDEVERTCPILNLLRHPQTVQTVLVHERPEDAALASGSSAGVQSGQAAAAHAQSA